MYAAKFPPAVMSELEDPVVRYSFDAEPALKKEILYWCDMIRTMSVFVMGCFGFYVLMSPFFPKLSSFGTLLFHVPHVFYGWAIGSQMWQVSKMRDYRVDLSKIHLRFHFAAITSYTFLLMLMDGVYILWCIGNFIANSGDVNSFVNSPRWLFIATGFASFISIMFEALIAFYMRTVFSLYEDLRRKMFAAELKQDVAIINDETERDAEERPAKGGKGVVSALIKSNVVATAGARPIFGLGDFVEQSMNNSRRKACRRK
jgi:ABC-type multidrug transport system fused ATPase/permease subunit